MGRLRVLAAAGAAATRLRAPLVVLAALTMAAASCTSIAAGNGTAPGSGESGANRARVSTVIASKICRQPAPSSTPVRGSARHAARTAPPPPAAVIRVDQVGYPAAAPKLAEIMAAAAQGAFWEMAEVLLSHQGALRLAAIAQREHAGAVRWDVRDPAQWGEPFLIVRPEAEVVLAGDGPA